jgi:large subunit ribosomal protein L23
MEKQEKDQKLINLASLIKSHLLTEKTTNLYALRQYSFLVDPSLNKGQIKALLEILFSVKIKSVRSLNLTRKTKKVGKFSGKKAQYKKVYITLEADEKIANLFD